MSATSSRNRWLAGIALAVSVATPGMTQAAVKPNTACQAARIPSNIHLPTFVLNAPQRFALEEAASSSGCDGKQASEVRGQMRQYLQTAQHEAEGFPSTVARLEQEGQKLDGWAAKGAGTYRDGDATVRVTVKQGSEWGATGQTTNVDWVRNDNDWKRSIHTTIQHGQVNRDVRTVVIATGELDRLVLHEDRGSASFDPSAHSFLPYNGAQNSIERLTSDMDVTDTQYLESKAGHQAGEFEIKQHIPRDLGLNKNFEERIRLTHGRLEHEVETSARAESEDWNYTFQSYTPGLDFQTNKPNGSVQAFTDVQTMKAKTTETRYDSTDRQVSADGSTMIHRQQGQLSCLQCKEDNGRDTADQQWSFDGPRRW